LSPYSVFANSPISLIDPNGADTINLTTTTTRKKIAGVKNNLDGVQSLKIPEQITRTETIGIVHADGPDVFRITSVDVDIDENGKVSGTTSTTTLDLDDYQTFGRTGGHNMEGYLDDRYALASHAPTWLLKYYANKSHDIGVRSAIAAQSDMPFAQNLDNILTIAYTISGITDALDVMLTRDAFTNYINLASKERTIHILAGDATGGGHSWFSSLKGFTNGLTGAKSMFPINWSGEKIMHAISDVVVNNPWEQVTGKVGAQFTKSGAPVRFAVQGFYEGVEIKVITTANDIITAYPLK
jgi:hypothetical protein